MSSESWSARLRLLSDVSAADWVVAGLASWGDPVRVRSLVPAVFPAYARILPPAESEGRRWRWSEIAASTGAAVHAGARYREVSGWDRQPDAPAPQPWGVPQDGALPREETVALADVLAAFTTTPRQAYFCMWEGYGDEPARAVESRPWRVRTEHRGYHLLTGPVAAAAEVGRDASYRSASMWWPHDRGWLVATEIDGFNTYLGGSTDAVATLLRTPALEAVPADPDCPLDPSPWP